MAKNEKTMPRIMIAIPCTSMMDAKAAHSIGSAIIKSDGKVVDFIIRQSSEIASARTWLVQEALQKDLTHILFIDSDMYFQADIINKLVEEDKDIIGIEYNKRQFPLEMIGAAVEKRTEDMPYKARYAGTGVLLIKLDIFRDPKFGIVDEQGTRQPWFQFARGANGELVMGEDVWFCNIARSAGYDVWIDPRIKVGHVGEYIY